MPIALGLGAGADSRKPLGIAVVGGLLGSMLLTLMMVPVVYTLLARFEPMRKTAGAKADQPAGAPGVGSGVAPAVGGAGGHGHP